MHTTAQHPSSWYRNWLPLLCLCGWLSACDDDLITPKQVGTDEVVGHTDVALNAWKADIRSGESALGNLSADARWESASSRGYAPDVAIVNGGSIRFDASKREDGIYPAGPLTDEDINEIFPWTDDSILMINVTGEELKLILERSVSQLPGNETFGGFLHVSQNFQFDVDLSQPAQVISEAEILEPGERIRGMWLHGIEVQSTAVYRLAADSYLGGGGDGYLAMAQIPDELKEPVLVTVEDPENPGQTITKPGPRLYESLRDYLQSRASVAPQVEGRILGLDD